MLPLPVFAADDAGFVDAAEYTRIAARANQPVQTLNNPPREVVLAGDALTSAIGRLLWHGRHWSLGLAYTGSVIVTDFEYTPILVQQSHAGSLAFSTHHKYWNLAITAAGVWTPEWATSNLFYAPGPSNTPTETGGGTQGGQTGTTGGTGQTGNGQTGNGPTGSTMTTGTTKAVPTQIPLGNFIQFGAATASGGLNMQLGRHEYFSIYGGYLLGGGLDANSRRTLAEQYGPSAGLVFTAVPSRVDSWGTGLTFARSLTTGPCLPTNNNVPQGSICHEDIPTAALQETYRHALSHVASITATAGVSASVLTGTALTEAGPPRVGAEGLGLFPVLAVRYTQLTVPFVPNKSPAKTAAPAQGAQVPAASGMTLGLQWVPTVDNVTGLLDDRLQLLGMVGQQVFPRVSIFGSVEFSQSIPPFLKTSFSQAAPLFTEFTFDVEARYKLDHQVEIGIGEEDIWQKEQGYLTIANEIGYVAVTVRTLPARF